MVSAFTHRYEKKKRPGKALHLSIEGGKRGGEKKKDMLHSAFSHYHGKKRVDSSSHASPLLSLLEGRGIKGGGTVVTTLSSPGYGEGEGKKGLFEPEVLLSPAEKRERRKL